MPLRRLLPLLAALLALCAAVLVWRLAAAALDGQQQAQTSEQRVRQLRTALVAAEMVSRERGPTNGLLGEALPPRPERIKALREARERTDQAWMQLAQTLPALPDTAQREPTLARLQAAQESLAEARAGVDRLAALPKDERPADDIRGAVRAMVALVPLLAPAIDMLANEAQQAYPALADDVQGARLSAEMREYAGLLGSHLTAPLTARKPFTPAERLAIERTRGRLDELRTLLALRVQSPEQSPAVADAWREVLARYFNRAEGLLLSVIEQGESTGQFQLDPAAFAAVYVPEMNVMFTLRDALLASASAKAEAGRQQANRLLMLVAAVSALTLAALVGTMVQVQRRVLRPLAAATQALEALARQDVPPPLPAPVVQDEMAAVLGAVRTLQEQTRERAVLETERDALIERLRQQSHADFLTGLPNRRAFFDAASRELAQAMRHGHPLTVILFDVDHFKQFNDQLGHAAGDCALVEVARTVQRHMRAGDLVARFGGEEFVLLLVNCQRDDGLRFAERLRQALAEAPVTCPNGQVAHLTASLGVADSDSSGLMLEALLSQADAAMYVAKLAGRNRVSLADGLTGPRRHRAAPDVPRVTGHAPPA